MVETIEHIEAMIRITEQNLAQSNIQIEQTNCLLALAIAKS